MAIEVEASNRFDCQSNLLLANRLGRAAFDGIAAEGDLFLGRGLAENESLADAVVAAEKSRRIATAGVAVDAGGIDVEASGDVLREAIKDVGHGEVLGGWTPAPRTGQEMHEVHKTHDLLLAVQKYLATKPFDLHALHLFHLVVKHRSFTRAAREAGLSQSALTRQMQSLENRLGLDLINRTTRSVEVTEAGLYLAAEAARLIGGVTATLDGLHSAFGSARPEVRVSVSRTLAMAHMPGFFHANHQRHPEVACRVSYHAGSSILTALTPASPSADG